MTAHTNASKPKLVECYLVKILSQGEEEEVCIGGKDALYARLDAKSISEPLIRLLCIGGAPAPSHCYRGKTYSLQEEKPCSWVEGRKTL